MTSTMVPFSVRAPASSANLGPGFDALGLALDIWNTITVEPGGERVVVRYDGDAEGLNGHENYSVRAMRLLAGDYGRALPPFTMTCRIDVPVARGVGSSAAAIVAGLIAGNQLLGLGLDREALYRRAAHMEGHGDNVGAALYGGAILAAPGMPRPLLLTDGVSLGLVAVLFIPQVTGPTWVARGELPQQVPLADAAFNLGAASGLAMGLHLGDLGAIAAGMHDRLHQPPRSRLYPHLLPMMEEARGAGAIGACLSGAGPSVLALATPDRAEAVRQALAATAEEVATPGSSEIVNLSASGAELLTGPTS